MVKAAEASKRVVQTGTQQRSQAHYIQGAELVRQGQARHHQLHPRLLVPERRQPEVPGLEARQARLEALHRVGEVAPGDPGALLQVALVLGLRRRSGVRAADPLDRRRPLVHRQPRPADRHRARRPARDQVRGARHVHHGAGVPGLHGGLHQHHAQQGARRRRRVPRHQGDAGGRPPAPGGVRRGGAVRGGQLPAHAGGAGEVEQGRDAGARRDLPRLHAHPEDADRADDRSRTRRPAPRTSRTCR